MVKEFTKAELLDVSPDSTKLFLRFWGEGVLRVVQGDSWKSAFVTKPAGITYSGRFFSDSDALYFETGNATGKSGTFRVVADLRTGKMETRIDPYSSEGLYFVSYAMEDRVLLRAGFLQNPRRPEVLLRVVGLSDKEIGRVAFATGMAEFCFQCLG